MNGSDILVENEDVPASKQTPSKAAILEQKDVEKSDVTSRFVNIDVDDEKPAVENDVLKKERITYTIDELLQIRANKDLVNLMNRPAVLDEKFLKDGIIWDPEAWHRSNSSRSASPLVIDGKPAITDSKKFELIGDGIELAPKRQSFKLGCQVKAAPNNVSEKQPVDKTRRLTGRPMDVRKSFETNYKDGDSISVGTQEFEKMRRNQAFDRDRSSSNDRFTREKAFSYDRNSQDRSSYNKQHSGKYQAEKRGDELPEWMSDAPVVADDSLNFFSKHIEDEKKAFAAKSKKKVRISPDVEIQIANKKSRKTPSPASNKNADGFDINMFMKEVEYYPPKMFNEDVSDGGVRSRFTQFFQTQEQQQQSQQRSRSNSRNSRPPSGALVPDEVIAGPPISPVPQGFFAPIQPAPALVSAAANAHAVQSSNIANIIEKHRHDQLMENIGKKKREVRGSMSVEELEGSPKKNSSHTQPADSFDATPAPDKSAFNMFLNSMKAAGQLPDKPSPVVSGLPGHLLPQPPTRTSPVFEKLKRSLSRSPSPKDFAKAVSTVATIISTNPTIDKELAILKQSTVVEPIVNNNMTMPTPVGKSRLEISGSNTPKTPTQFRSSMSSPSMSAKKTPVNAFTPTSVLKKMHSEKKEEFKTENPDVSMVSVQSNGSFPDVLPDQAKTHNSEKRNLDSQFIDAAFTPDRLPPKDDEVSKYMPFHSAPVTPKNHFSAVSSNTISASAPGSPSQHQNGLEPPFVHRLTVQPPGFNDQKDDVLQPPSAFKAVNSSSSSNNDLGAIGSGSRHGDKDAYNKFVNQLGQMHLGSERISPRQIGADPKLAPGNGARHPESGRNAPVDPLKMNQHSGKPQSQQQQLLQAQRMVQIQQAQLLQQQKLQEIAKLGRQGNMPKQDGPNSFSPLLPDPEKMNGVSNQQMPRRPPLYQHQQHQQVLAYQQQQQQQQQQLLRQHHQRNQPQPGFNNVHHPRMPGQPPHPLHMQPNIPGMPPFQQPPMNPVNLAAQALVQQQLMNQAARARLFAQATLLQQQPQQVMQAALMAQAALVRGQAQAQAAMMLNPRNFQAMAEKMGMRQPFNPNKQNGKRHTPTTPSPDNVPGMKGDQGNVLSKWFSNDVLKQMPPQSQASTVDASKAKIFSVEELERGQK